MNIEKFFNKAVAAQKDNNAALAKTLYQEILAAEPAHLPSLFNLGTVLANEYDFKAARVIYLKLIALEPDYVRGLFNCAWCCLQVQEIEEAKSYLQHAIALVPEYAAAQHLLGSILIKEGAFAEAEQHLTMALQEDPTLAEAYCHLGMVKMHQQYYDEAKSLLEQALAIEPFHAEAYYHLALVHLKHGDLHATESCLQNAIDRDPNHFSALYNMALLKKQQHFYGLADEYLARAQMLKPEDQHVLFLRASLRGGNTESAPPQAFVNTLFDGYADHYDTHMTQVLHYQVPQQLLSLFETDIPTTKIRILDLGCGTGLCGPLFKSYAGDLIGFDLSQPMLDQANKRGCYDELKHGDIVALLCDLPEHSIDICIAADVLGYIGKLDTLFEQVSRILKPGGRFLFSIETGQADFHLNQTTRFSHSPDYIQRLSSQYQLQIKALIPGVLREQEGHAVQGHYVSLARSGNVA